VPLRAEGGAGWEALTARGPGAALGLPGPRILLRPDGGDDGPAWRDTQVAAARDVAVNTVANTRQRFVEGGLPRALNRKAQDRPSRVRVLDGRAEARLIALACSDPPAGRAHWTLSLLADRLVGLRVGGAVSPKVG